MILDSSPSHADELLLAVRKSSSHNSEFLLLQQASGLGGPLSKVAKCSTRTMANISFSPIFSPPVSRFLFRFDQKRVSTASCADGVNNPWFF